MKQEKTILRLRARLAARFELAESAIMLPRSRRTFRIYQPASFDPLLDAAVDDPEQNLPYWAISWPSGVALADVALTNPRRFAGKRVLELGCGLGVTAAAVLAAGADLIATDYGASALLLCRLNALENARRQPYTLQINWREPDTTLFALARPTFPEILAADVLYESRDVQPLLSLAERLLSPGGTLWLAEPRRKVAGRFVSAALAAGWQDEVDTHTGPWPTAGDEDIVVDVHRLRREPRPA
jgi:predicted nicotinamide N-methyase